MKKVYYKFYSDDFNDLSNSENFLNHFLEPCVPQTSSWFSSLDLLLGSAKNVMDFFKSNRDGILNFLSENNGKSFGAITTVKACPGIKQLFSNSYLVKCPCDVIVYQSKDQIAFNLADDNLLNIDNHSSLQFRSKTDSLFSNKINVKFSLPLRFQSSVDVLMLPPHYHAENPFTTLCGKMFTNHPHDMNVNTMLPTVEEDTEFMIKAGTPLAYLYFHEKVKFVPTKKRLAQYRTKLISNKSSDYVKVIE